MDYRIVIGLEVHVQLLTRTKLFCGCANRFGLPPNSATCPVCLGLPGVLPVMNRTAFELALKAALALNCRIAPFTKWDRKNYYYPDLNAPEEAVTYLQELRLLLRELGVSDCEMQEGSLRCDANVNIHVGQADGSVVATPIVEVKNLNSFRAVERAMKYEAERQYSEFQNKIGGPWELLFGDGKAP